MNNLKFRRQFLLTPTACVDLTRWQTERIGDYFLYVHPDCQLAKASKAIDIYLIGYFLDPHNPEKSSNDIIGALSLEKNITNIPTILYRLVGRFVLIIKQKNDLIFFNDACGLKTFYYTKNGNELYAASQPLLIDKVLKLNKTSAYNEYFNSHYVAKNKEHFLPSGVTFYENVFHLVPNHYLRLSDYIQKRYWPHKKLQVGNYNILLNQFASLLKEIMVAANKHMDLAVSLTAGWDSRIILSSTKDFYQDVVYYTLRYRNMDNNHMDIKIPVLLSKSMNFKHSIYDCEVEITEEFANIYKQNTDMAHVHDWGKIAYGMFKSYPQGKVAVKGSCSEIGRCYYYPNGKRKKVSSEMDFLRLENGWENISFIKENITDWYSKIKKEENNYGYDLYDLYYWEQRLGSWQGQSQLEWDIVQEAFTPFNSRELLDLMLSIDGSYRKAENPLLYRDSIEKLWSETLSEPINPNTFRTRTILFLKSTGLLPVLRNILGR